jgi:hypothetical protein
MLHQKKRITHFQKGQDESTCVFQQHSFKKKGRGWGEVSRKTFPFLFFIFTLVILQDKDLWFQTVLVQK